MDGDERPRYREAYPQFDIIQAMSALNRGHLICEFTDRWGDARGVARFDVCGNRCQLEFDFHFPHTETRTGTGTGWMVFELTPISNGIAKNRVMLLCPACETKKRILFFKDTWSCASCLELSFRSQLIHPLTKKWEKVDQLATRLSRGKPHGIHNTTYAKHLLKLENLRQELYGKNRCYASDKYSAIIECNWRSLIKKDELSFPNADFSFFLTKAGTVGSDPSPPALIGPVDFDGGPYRALRHGYETSDPEDL